MGNDVPKSGESAYVIKIEKKLQGMNGEVYKITRIFDGKVCAAKFLKSLN